MISTKIVYVKCKLFSLSFVQWLNVTYSDILTIMLNRSTEF